MINCAVYRTGIRTNLAIACMCFAYISWNLKSLASKLGRIGDYSKYRHCRVIDCWWEDRRAAICRLILCRVQVCDVRWCCIIHERNTVASSVCRCRLQVLERWSMYVYMYNYSHILTEDYWVGVQDMSLRFLPTCDVLFSVLKQQPAGCLLFF